MTGASVASHAPFFFASHASLDNDRLRPVLVHLLDAGIPIWFDKPQSLDPPISEERFVGCIIPGGDQEDADVQIDRARWNACGMILFAGPAAGGRDEVRIEVQGAMRLALSPEERAAFADAKGDASAAETLARLGERAPFVLHSALLSEEGLNAPGWRGLKKQAFQTLVARPPGTTVYALTAAGLQECHRFVERLKAHLEHWREYHEKGLKPRGPRKRTIDDRDLALSMFDRHAVEAAIQEDGGDAPRVIVSIGQNNAAHYLLPTRLQRISLPYRRYGRENDKSLMEFLAELGAQSRPRPGWSVQALEWPRAVKTGVAAAQALLAQARASLPNSGPFCRISREILFAAEIRSGFPIQEVVSLVAHLNRAWDDRRQGNVYFLLMLLGQDPDSLLWRFNRTQLAKASAPVIELRQVEESDCAPWSQFVSNAWGCSAAELRRIAGGLAFARRKRAHLQDIRAPLIAAMEAVEKDQEGEKRQ